MGRFPEALAELQRAQRLDPTSLIINADLGLALYFARRYGEAIDQLRKNDTAIAGTTSMALRISVINRRRQSGVDTQCSSVTCYVNFPGRRKRNPDEGLPNAEDLREDFRARGKPVLPQND